MALAIVVVLTLFPLLALATYTPRPLEVAVLLVSLAAAGTVALASGDAFLSASVFFLVASACFTLKTASEVVGSVRAVGERRRRRPPRRRPPVPEAEPWWAPPRRERDAA